MGVATAAWLVSARVQVLPPSSVRLTRGISAKVPSSTARPTCWASSKNSRSAAYPSRSRPWPVSYTHLDVYKRQRQRIVDIAPHEKGEAFEELPMERFEGHTRAFMKIEDGCNRQCAYCAVSYTHLDVYKRQRWASKHGWRGDESGKP